MHTAQKEFRSFKIFVKLTNLSIRLKQHFVLNWEIVLSTPESVQSVVGLTEQFYRIPV